MKVRKYRNKWIMYHVVEHGLDKDSWAVQYRRYKAKDDDLTRVFLDKEITKFKKKRPVVGYFKTEETTW